MLLLPATATAGAATTDGPATVAVLPLHERAVDITLIGASTQGVAVLAAGVSRQSEEMVWTGDWDGPLTARPQVRTAEGFRAYFRELGVFGDTLAWGRVRSGSMSSGTALYRTDLVSGRTSLDGWVSGVTSVLTEQGMDQTWISSSDPWSELPPYRQGLVRSPVTTAPGSDADWPQESDLWRPGPGRELDSWTADDAGAVVVTRRAVDDEPLTDGDTDGDAELVEVPLDGGPARTVLAAGSVRSDDVEHMEAGAGTIVWAREAYGGRAGAVWTMPRAGGPVTAQVEDDPRAELSTLSVSALGTVGYLVRGPAGRRTLRTIADGVVRDLPLPVGSSGLTAVGADFVTATGRGPQPGVYRIRPGAEPVLDVGFAPARYPIGGWDLAAGRLFYADRSAGGARRLPLFSRAVDAVPALGPQEQQQAWAGAAADAPGAMPMSFSAGRAVLGSPSANLLWDVLDRGRRTVSVEQEPLPGRGTAFPSITDPVMSGPYLLLGRQVHRSDGSLLHRLPVAVARTGRADLFGPTVVYATHLRGRGRVWLFDVENGRRQRVSDVACTHAPQVAIWGRTLAWADCDAAQVRVRDLVTGATRRIATGIDPATAPARIHLSLGEGADHRDRGWGDLRDDRADQAGRHRRPLGHVRCPLRPAQASRAADAVAASMA